MVFATGRRPAGLQQRWTERLPAGSRSQRSQGPHEQGACATAADTRLCWEPGAPSSRVPHCQALKGGKREIQAAYLYTDSKICSYKPLDQWFAAEGGFARGGVESGNSFGCHRGRATGTQCAEAREAVAKHPAGHRADARHRGGPSTVTKPALERKPCSWGTFDQGPTDEPSAPPE